ncbi:MAG: hypothetical protein QM831_37280 [Kofleriaceae bacterium]
MTKHIYLIAMLASCTADVDENVADTQNDYTSDPWPQLDRTEREGPPRYYSRVHSCPKIRYNTLGHVLASRGVNVAATGSDTAGQIYTSSKASLGGPNYSSRTREVVELGVATESKMFDIFVEAAPEIIAAMPNRPECQKNGVGVKLFDANNKCQIDGISCLIGMPATQTHVDICDMTVARSGSDVEQGKQLAVAVLAAAAHTCE